MKIEVGSLIETFPVELVEKILTTANNPLARAVNRTFRDVQRAVDIKTINQYLQQPCINRFVSHEFATFPHDLMNPDAYLSRHQMIQKINRAIITPALNRYPLILSPTTVFPAEQLNEHAQSVLDYNLLCILRELFVGRFNQPARDNLDPDSMQGLIESLHTLPTMAEHASAIRSWMEENKEALAQITHLIFKAAGLTYIPPELAIYFPNLEVLHLGDNQLKTLPEGFGSSWMNLQMLFLHNNQLDTLPEDFGSTWVNLQKLSLDDNQLKTLPEGFGSTWTNLQELSLSENQLNTLSEDFGSTWVNLERLYLDNNRLEALTKGFGFTWTNLQELSLSKNQLSTFPEDFGFTWENLQRLFWCNNPLIDMRTLSARLLNMLSMHLLKETIFFFESFDSKEEQLKAAEKVKKIFNEKLSQPFLDSIHHEVWAATELFFPGTDPNFGRHTMWENIPRLCAVLQKLIHKNTPQRPLDNAIQAIRYYASLRFGGLRRTITEHVCLALAELDVDTRHTIYTKVWERRESSHQLQQLDETDPNFGENNVAADLDLLCDILNDIRESPDE